MRKGTSSGRWRTRRGGGRGWRKWNCRTAREDTRSAKGQRTKKPKKAQRVNGTSSKGGGTGDARLWNLGLGIWSFFNGLALELWVFGFQTGRHPAPKSMAWHVPPPFLVPRPFP